MLISRNGSNIGYTSYNLPSVINAGTGYSSTLSYGAFRNRYKQIAVTPTTTETTIYVAGLMEKVTRGSSIEYRHLIHGGQGTAAIHTRVVGGASSTYYLHRDHLGSPELITDSSGNEVVRPSFGAYGERRDGTDWSGPPSIADLTDIANTIRRGFTGHEHLDAVNLIHMNGRVYEPVAGRFLGVDPIVHIGNGQSPNSYTYVWNNPLTLIDPSGFDGEDVVTESEPQPRYFPQCPYQIANIAVDCPYQYGWRWSDIRWYDRWMMEEYRVEMWVRSHDDPLEVVIASSAVSDGTSFGGPGVMFGVGSPIANRYIFQINTRGKQFPEWLQKEFIEVVELLDAYLTWGTNEQIDVFYNPTLMAADYPGEPAITTRTTTNRRLTIVFAAPGNREVFRSLVAEEIYHAADWTQGLLHEGVTERERNESEIRAREFVLRHRHLLRISESRATAIRESIERYRRRLN